MKKLIALLLVLALMLGVTGALAEKHTKTETYEDGTYDVSWWDDAGNGGWTYYAADGTMISGMEQTFDADTGITTSKHYNSDGETYIDVWDGYSGTGHGV